jgi:CelD/BcsL family acetyltransferase involved in cellulose biosynthesis
MNQSMVAIPQIQVETSPTVYVIRATEDLLHLGPEWKELFHRIGCDNVFLSFEWLSEWWLHFGQDHQLFVIVVRDKDGRLAAVAPLYLSLHAGPLRLRRLNFLGDRLVGSDYLDFLVDDTRLPSALQCIQRCILENRRLWDYIQLLDVKADSIAATAFRASMKASGATATMAYSSVCPYEKLPQSLDEYLARLNSKLKKTLRYRSRNLQREGEVEYQTIDRLPDIEVAFDHVLRLHRSRFESLGASSAFLGPTAEAFHRAAVRSLAKAGWARVHVLNLGGKCIAACYQLSSGRKIFAYQIGIDPEFARFSTGQQLTLFSIEWAIAGAYAEFDLLRGNEAYKSDWAHDVREVYTLQFFDGRARSRIAAAGKSVRAFLRKCKTRLVFLKQPAKRILDVFRIRG